jgi:hypothetical protein
MESQTRVVAITKAGRVARPGTRRGWSCGVSQDQLFFLSAIMIRGKKRFFLMDIITALKE